MLSGSSLANPPPSLFGKGAGGLGSWALALALLFVALAALAAQPPGLDPLKKIDPPKADPKDTKDSKDAKPQVVKLPDGTYLWLGAGGDGEKVTLTPQEFQKLLDRADALKKELIARKPVAPSGCAVRAEVKKRGEQLVAVLRLTYTFRTAQPNSAVSLGGKKAFLVGATLDDKKLPVLDTGDDGFAVLVEAAGDHTLTLDVEAPVGARGAKSEIGFDIGLPRAPITTFALAAPGDVKRASLTTRTPDPAQPAKAPEVRRHANLDVKQLAPGLPLGPVDSLEVTWEPPAAGALPADQVQSAELDVSATLTDGFIESTAKVRLRGPALQWKLVAPATADVTVERAGGAGGDPGPAQQPVVTKPTDNAKVVWKIDLPAGSSAADWTVTAVVRVPRPKAGAKSATVPVGPFTVLDVLRQAGTVRVTAGPHTRFVFRHGPDLRRAELPGPPDDEVSAALFRLATGPTGGTAVNAPLLTVEAWPVEGTVRVKPTYRLKLTDAVWHVRAEIAVKPVRTEVDALAIDVPAGWRGLESESDPEVVEGVTQGKGDDVWRPVTVKLAAGFKQPFTVVLVATVPVEPNARATVAFPRFPKVTERDATVLATVADGLEVRGQLHGWDGDVPAAWGAPLAPVPGPDGKPPKSVSAVTGRGERGIARVAISWQPYRPDATAEVRADVTIGERQVLVSQTIRVRSADGFPKPLRFRGPAGALGLKATPALDVPAPGVWSFAPPVDAKDATLKVTFALPLPANLEGPVALPVGLLWLADATRTDAHVRVWASVAAGRTVGPPATGWRELPADPATERDTLPALTLSASGEQPLNVELRPAAADSAAALWVERALVEAGMTEDGTIGYRARFRLERWLTPTAEVWLPDGAGAGATIRVDGATAVPVPSGDGRVRVALPDGAPGRTVVLEVLYALPGARRSFGETTYTPPRLTSAAYTGGVRWLVTEPADAAPLLLGGGSAEIRWRARGICYAPTAATRAAADRWFVHGTEPNDTATGAEGETLMVRQSAPEPVRVARVPWLALVIGWSLVAALLILLPTWLPASVSGVLVALLAGTFCAAALLYPQPTAQVLAAAQPGQVLGVFAALVQALIRWQVRQRVAHLPGFTRTLPEPSAVGPSTAGGSQAAVSVARSRTGSTGTPAPAAPGGSGS
jgi:hypothetical protein